jgi:hypothetical protein
MMEGGNVQRRRQDPGIKFRRKALYTGSEKKSIVAYLVALNSLIVIRDW